MLHTRFKETSKIVWDISAKTICKCRRFALQTSCYYDNSNGLLAFVKAEC